jgi:ligand-binding sensor protein
MRNNILKMIDFEELEDLFNQFYNIIKLPIVIMDLEGKIIARTPWQEICDKFHRAHPQTAQNCLKSDTELAGKRPSGQKYYFYRCLNGLMDVVVPINIITIHMSPIYLQGNSSTKNQMKNSLANKQKNMVSTKRNIWQP